jgi:hypothetical protein
MLVAEAEVEQRYNIWMLEAHCASLGEKALKVLIAGELELKEFDRYLRAIMNVFSLVDNAKGALTKLMEQTIFPDLLADADSLVYH